MIRNPSFVIVDLSSQKVLRGSITRDEQERYIGGFGINVLLAERYISPGVEPLSAENPIIIGSGPLAGTLVPGAARLSVITKLPLNGAIGGNSGSMGFSAYMRWSDMDHLVVSGVSPNPCYLLLTEKGVQFIEASDLWGLDTYEVTDILMERYEHKASVMTIGALGETVSPIALAFVDKAATVGKGGLAAVMGYKRLKAIVAAGRQPVEVPDRRGLGRAMTKISKEMQADSNKDNLIHLGTMAGWDGRAKSGIPYQNWTRLYSKDKATVKYGPEVYLKKIKAGRVACLGCTLPDKEMLNVPMDYAGKKAASVDFTYASSFSGRAVNYGIRCGADDAINAVILHDVANRNSVCDHHWSATVDLAFDLRNLGVLGNSWKGSELLFPGFKTTMKLLQMTIRGEGVGKLLARGIPGLLAEFGEKAEERAIHVQGMDMVFDPRSEGLGTKELSQIVSPRRHWVSGYTNPYQLGMDGDDLHSAGAGIGLSVDAVGRILPNREEFHIGRMLPHVENWYAVLSSVGICTRSISRYYNPQRVALLLSAVTGINWSPAQLLNAGKRSWDLLRRLNEREGIGRGDDRFPPRWLKEPILNDKGEKFWIRDLGPGQRILEEGDLQSVLEEYYIERGWNYEKNQPDSKDEYCTRRDGTHEK